MTQKTYYEILGVSANADYGKIKRTYRQLAKKLHPDKILGATENDRLHFAKIAEAYTVLSDLDKRKKYDQSLNANSRRKDNFFSHPHYSGYPYFRYDVFTPFFHGFFMSGVPPVKSRQILYLTILFNWRVILVSILGALVFFKFFTAIDGKIKEKTIKAGWLKNVSYLLKIKNFEGKNSKKRVRPELYEWVKREDQIVKRRFSFSYSVNGKKWNQVTMEKFLFRIGLIYTCLCMGLLFLERSRK